MKIAFCFDMDGTLTEEEILPKIAKRVGIHEEIEILTKITMNGLMTFDKSFKLRVKLLSTIPISEVEQIVSEVKINSELQNFVRANHNDSYIITGNLDVWIQKFIQQNYNCNFYCSKADFKQDQLNGLTSILNKGDAITELKKKYDIVVAVGDGMNDCSMFEKSDIRIAFGGVHDPVNTLISLSDYVCYDAAALNILLMSIKQFYHES